MADRKIKDKKRARRQRIHYKIRSKISGVPERPRLSVYRSNKFIYAQLIDDISGHTIAAASSRENGFDNSGTKTEIAQRVGQLIADRAKAAGSEEVVFDRGGYLYHGRIKALAEGARQNGLNF